MKTVSLRSVTLEKFRSFLRPATIDLAGNPGLVLISGDNRAEPRLGANGAGKSTVLDAICFCLYGTSVRGLKGTDLVSHGQKSAKVTLSLSVDGVDYVITRTGPPDRLQLDSKPVEQVEVDRLVGLSRPRFLSSVVFGQAVPLFIDRSIPDRGELLDEVMDLKVWLRAADAANKRCATVAVEQTRLKVDVGRADGALEALGSTDELVAKVDAWDAGRDQRLGDARATLTAARTELDAASLERDGMTLDGGADDAEAEARLESVRKRESRAETALAVLMGEVKVNRAAASFLVDNAFCPTCRQDIDRDFADAHRTTHEVDGQALDKRVAVLQGDLVVIRAAVVKRRAAVNEARRLKSEHEARMARLDADVKVKSREVRYLAEEVRRIEVETNPHSDRLDALRITRRDLKIKLRDLRRDEAALVSKITALDYWRQGFKRVRLFCMGRALAQLELDTMNAANSLGLVGWTVSYATETETKSGTSKTGVQVTITSPTSSGHFTLISPGEGQRVRLCVALGLAGLIQRWSGVRWDFEAFDEPTNWLSEAGIEDLLDLLRTRAEQYSKRVFLCDHRGLQHAGIDRVIRVVKDEAGSSIEVR